VDREGAAAGVVPTLPVLAEEPAFMFSAAEFAAKSAHEFFLFITILHQNAKTPILSFLIQLQSTQFTLYAIFLF
jgi:hypothetical protein